VTSAVAFPVDASVVTLLMRVAQWSPFPSRIVSFAAGGHRNVAHQSAPRRLQ